MICKENHKVDQEKYPQCKDIFVPGVFLTESGKSAMGSEGSDRRLH